MSYSLITKVVLKNGEIDLREFERFTIDERLQFVEQLIRLSDSDVKACEIMIRYIAEFIPFIRSDKRFPCLSKALNQLFDSNKLYGKELYHILASGIVESLQPLERINLAGLLSEKMNHCDHQLRVVAMWALVAVIPTLHHSNQNSYAMDIFKWHRELSEFQLVQETLTFLFYSVDHKHRLDLVKEFKSILTKSKNLDTRSFVLVLMKKAVPALTETDRVELIHDLFPYLNDADTEVVRLTLQFLGVTSNLIPQNELKACIEKVGQLTNTAVRDDALQTLQIMIPFVADQQQRSQYQQDLQHGISGINDRLSLWAASPEVSPIK